MSICAVARLTPLFSLFGRGASATLPGMKLFSKIQSMGAAAVILAASIFLSRFMGLIRDKIISYYYGATPETDIFVNAFVIPDFINYLLAGGYFSITLIPLLARFFEKDEADGWRFFSAVLCWLCLFAVLLTLLAWVFAAPLAALAAPGLPAHLQPRLVRFLRIILPAQACFLPGACFTAVLYYRRQFAVPALSPLIYNLCIIMGGLLCINFFPDLGMEGFCWGVLSGAALGSLALPAWGVFRGGAHISPVFTHSGLKKFVLLALPLMLGQSIVALDEQFLRIFGLAGGEGAVTMLNYARRLMQVPVGVVAQAAGVASFPFLAALAAKADKDGFDRTVRSALLASLGVIIPVAFWMIAVSGPTIRLIFQQGRFSAEQAGQTGLLLAIMLCGVGFWAVQQVLGRGFYAHENTVTPVLAGTASTLASLPLYWGLGRLYGASGVALAGVCGIGLYTSAMLLLWVKHFGGGALRGLFKRFVQCSALSALAAAVSYAPVAYLRALLPEKPLSGAFLGIAASGVCFALAYLPLSRLLAPDLLEDLLGGVKRKLKK